MSTPTIFAWEMYYDGMGGLKVHVWRKFMLIDEYVIFGMTNLNTGNLKWSVAKCESAEAAQAQAIVLTERSEEWGCNLTEAPRFRSLDGANYTFAWLDKVVDVVNVTGPQHEGLDLMFNATMKARSMDPLVSAREWSELYE